MTLDELEKELAVAKVDPWEYFQDHTIRKFKIACHPDRWLDQADRAKPIFDGFCSAYDESQKVENVGGYRLVRKIARGDLFDVYSARLGDEWFVIKRPRVAAKKLLVKDRAEFKKLKPYSLLLPDFVGEVDGCNVFRVDSIRETLSQVVQRKGKLDGRHVAWMMKRVLMALAHVHAEGCVNGAVTPDHIVINKDNHGIVLLGWIHSGKPGDAIQVVPAKWKHYYPAWASTEKKLCTELDFHMIGQTFMDVMADDAPMKIKAFIGGLRNRGVVRGWSAMTVHEHFDDVLRRVYGKPKWVNLD